MTTARRRREWVNQEHLLTPVATGQDSTTIVQTDFSKGCTVVRIILEVAMTPVTPNVDALFTIAVWAGSPGGVPTNIRLDNNYGFMMWERNVMNRSDSVANGATERFMRRSFDLRGQRKSREDTDEIAFIAEMGAGSAGNIYVSSRVLCLLA